MKKFVSKRYIEDSTQWKLEKREFEARQRGLCIHCYGVGKQNETNPIITKERKYKPCRHCRATGRDLDLEARSYEVHTERISKLSFAQMIREYVQLYKKEYVIEGFQPLTTDERRWRSALVNRLQYEFRIGSQGHKGMGAFGYYWNFPYFESVMWQWTRRLLKQDEKLKKYVWEK